MFREESTEIALFSFISFVNYAGTILSPSNGIQLPQCPLCIEKLDVSVSGLSALTSSDIIAYAYPHNGRRWTASEEACKVCQVQRGKSLSCVCGIKESLWICQLCGYIGCGRYQQGHAYKHFLETMHSFAVDIESGRIWHYRGDGYVHRIIKGVVNADVDFEIQEDLFPASPTEVTVYY